MSTEWWELKFSGVKDLTDSDLENIAEKIKGGFREGQVIQEDGPPNLKEIKLPEAIKVEFGDDKDYFEVSTEIKFEVGQGKKLVEHLKWTKEFYPYGPQETDMYYEMKKGKIFLGYRTYEKGDRVGIVKDFMKRVLKVKEFLKK